MKNIVKILVSVIILNGFSSCQDFFLQKPDVSGTVDLDKVFSTTKNAEAALFRCYRDVLIHGWAGGIGWSHGTLGAISGEVSKGWSWHATWEICTSGLKPTVPKNGSANTAGAENYNRNWECIRECFIVRENIHKVADMSDEMKEYIKGEATALIAYRYMGMFYRYGGVPIVRRSFMSSDPDLQVSRASLSDTYEYILELLEDAYAAVPDSWAGISGEGTYVGRMTKGAVLAMKARLNMYAARPLFNSSEPYLAYLYPELICFGNYDEDRWDAAISANLQVLEWAKQNGYELINTGGNGIGQPNENAIQDYGTATSVPNNREVLLAYKLDEATTGMTLYYNTGGYAASYWGDHSDSGNSGILTNHLEKYYDINGNDLDWPKIGESSPRPASNFFLNMENAEARLRVDMCTIGVPSVGNPGNNSWNATGWGRRTVNMEISTDSESAKYPGAAQTGYGAGASTKFYYGAGSRLWFEPPLFRMAEIYLNLAEAYNEIGETSLALENLNMVHNRAGLPSINETGQPALREIIKREKALEFFHENHRYYDVKHWKDKDIANIFGGPKRELQFHVTANSGVKDVVISYWDAVAYETYWNPKMHLEPFPQNEINKGIIHQNPGY